MNNVDEFVYRVFKEPEFYRFKKYKFFEGNKLDKDSGFIHLSTNDQINGTIQKYFCDLHKKSLLPHPSQKCNGELFQ